MARPILTNESLKRVISGKDLLIQRRRAIEAVEARAPPPQYCDCGPDWPLLFKVHEIWSIDSQENH